MNEQETDKQILARMNELLAAIDLQGKKIDDINTRLEKLEKVREIRSRIAKQCDGDCFSISDECQKALDDPDKYKPQPGEKYLKEDNSQAEYRNSFWKKFS
ncbi:MAG: hypothetical protein WCJ93_03640 [Methanomicrobiales archaeon]